MTGNVHSPEGDFTFTTDTELTDYNVKIPPCCPMTIVLGSDSKDLNTLRQFRDEVLSKTPAGQEIVKLYYQLSPALVSAMEEDEAFKKEVNKMIEEVLPLVS